jgi:pimeloyl-ACP methyl ester carboxylesterase
MTTTSIAYKYLTLSHGQTRYIEAGQGDPVILIHGYPYMRSADDWLPNIDALASKFRVLAPDCLGWAPSDVFDQEYSFAYLTDFVREFQDALGIKSSHIVGASMGGWIAGLLAYESPERVQKVVQTGHNGIGARPNAGMTNWKPPADEAIRDWVVRVTTGAGVDTEALVKERLEKAHEPGRMEAFAKLSRHMGDGVNRARYDLMRRLPLTQAPTLYVWGNKDGSFPVAEEAKRLTPNSKLVVLDCGHDVSLEMPAEFNNAVLEFLS